MIDLLAPPLPDGTQPKRDLRGLKGSAGFTVLEEHVEPVYSSGQLTELIEKAMSRRNVTATQQNEHSSRSHAFLTLHLERRSATSVTNTQMYLVDLAGSETFSEQMPHGGINVGLLSLGQVRPRHTP